MSDDGNRLPLITDICCIQMAMKDLGMQKTTAFKLTRHLNSMMTMKEMNGKHNYLIKLDSDGTEFQLNNGEVLCEDEQDAYYIPIHEMTIREYYEHTKEDWIWLVRDMFKDFGNLDELNK